MKKENFYFWSFSSDCKTQTFPLFCCNSSVSSKWSVNWSVATGGSGVYSNHQKQEKFFGWNIRVVLIWGDWKQLNRQLKCRSGWEEGKSLIQAWFLQRSRRDSTVFLHWSVLWVPTRVVVLQPELQPCDSTSFKEVFLYEESTNMFSTLPVQTGSKWLCWSDLTGGNPLILTNSPLVWYHRWRRRKEEVQEEQYDIEEGKQKDSELFCDMEVKWKTVKSWCNQTTTPCPYNNESQEESCERTLRSRL